MPFILNRLGAQLRPGIVNSIVATLLICGVTACSSDDEPEQVTGPGNENQLKVASGTFEVTSNVIFTTCNNPPSFDGEYDVQITDQDFTMGTDWVGSWNPNNSTALGESEHVRTVIRFCTITEWTEVNITFSSEDEFTGDVIYRRRVNGDCSSPCTTTWGIAGVRKPATP